MRAIVAIAVATAVLATGCAQRGEAGSDDPTFEELTADPEAFDGREVRVEAGYYGAFETSVLTSGFAESFPPQPIEPTVWVSAAAPSGDCLDRAQGVIWADAVEATGTFRYEPDGGFGHLGAYEMVLENATLSCT